MDERDNSSEDADAQEDTLHKTLYRRQQALRLCLNPVTKGAIAGHRSFATAKQYLHLAGPGVPRCRAGATRSSYRGYNFVTI
jgi:hypothetical protein